MPLPGTVSFPATVVLMLWCALRALTADAWATLLDRVEFESASERTGAVLSPGDRIQGNLAKPDGAGPFPAVIVLHGCAGMHDTTRLTQHGYDTCLTVCTLPSSTRYIMKTTLS
jgi:poly(3-hydroxybutyrate) depolymerase